MTIELFRSDPYRSEFVAQVTSCEAGWVALDRTCFWPGDDDSPCDTGWLGNHRVVEVRRGARSVVLHRLKPVDALAKVAALSDQDSEVLAALTALGYSVVEAQTAIQSLPKDAPEDVEERLRMALGYFQ